MNKAYRLVWSDPLDSFVVVPEFARSRGKGGGRVLIAALALSALFMSAAGAQVNVATGNTTVSAAANGVPVVSIATTSATGLSHNKYNNFNVASQGLVFNNNASAAAVVSQLAVAVAKNANLTHAANLILNEVVIANRSALNGYMEVAGSRASVVVANPWGITCNGCGFINTDRATLSTGVPVIAGDGSLAGLRVNQGDILFTGAGFSGTNQNILDIVARSVKVDGKIEASDLQLVAGNNDYNYANRTATALAATGVAPAYAIDSTLLGGMYAQKISIIATEQGVGVRSLGDVAARASDFTLSAAGTIEIVSKSISARGNIAINSAALVSTSAATVIDAGGTFSDLGGGALNNQGRITGAQGFNLNLSSLSNGSTSNSSARIASTQDSANSANASSISATGDVANYGAIHSADDLSISASRIMNQNTGGITSGQALNLAATSSIDNSGALFSGDRGLNLKAVQIDNRTGGTIEAVTGISSQSSVFNNYSVIRAEDISVVTDKSFYNGLDTAITPVMDFSTKVASSANEPKTQIDFWQENKTCARCNESWLYQDAVTYREQYSSPLPGVKPQMLALSTLRLNYGQGTATNYAGILSGDLVSITGSGTFTNRDLSLAEVTYYRRADEFKEDHWYWAWGALYTDFAATAGNPLASAALSENERKQLTRYPSVADALEHSARTEKSRVIYSSSGAGVYANTLEVSAGQVNNLGSPLGYSDSRLTQGGFTITLPTNPNGHYIVSGDPKSKYLVRTNADFVNRVSDMTTEDMEKAIGYSPDDELIRLGDDGYEDALIDQQLVALNASQLLPGNGAELISRLRGDAVAEAKSLGLKYGTAPTPDQLKRLDKDIVWMVKTTVNGKEVLAPRVYLSASTQAGIRGGAVIAAKNTSIDAASVSNRGAVIAGTQSLAIKASGNISNASGTMTGGQVSLAAQGDISNQTVTQAQGDKRTFRTTVGKTGQIEATTGALEMSSGRQITVQGASLKAAKDVSLSAVGAVTVESMVDKSSTSTSTSTVLNKKKRQNTKAFKNDTNTTVNNIGSTVFAGAGLGIASGADITVKGSKTDARGEMVLQSKGDVKVLADQNKTMTHSEAKNTGRGVGGGFWGKQRKTSDIASSTNAGSTVATAGNADIQSDGKLAVQGSQVKIGGNANLVAKQGIAVSAGKNESATTSTTKTTTFLKTGDGKGTQAVAKKPVAAAKASNGQASSNAEVSAEASSKHDFKLYERTTTTQIDKTTTSVGSNLSVGGKLNATTDKTLAVQGSSVDAGKAMNLNAGKVDIVAGSSSQESSTKSSSFSIGAYETSGARASAQAKSEARGSSGGGAASASASAKASAESSITLGFQKGSESKKSSATTHTGSTLSSGGDTNIAAKGDATFAGAKVNSAGNIDIKAANINNVAVQNTSQKTSAKDSHLAGINYAGAASAGASANTGAQAGIGGSAEAGVKVEAKVEATAGVGYKNEQEKAKTGSVTQVTNSFTANKDITRTAADTLKDQGTQMQAGGSINQTARVITDQAVSNSTTSSTSSQNHDARIGLHVGAAAEAGASASIGVGAGDSGSKTAASAGVGAKASYSGRIADQNVEQKKAVTSSYTAGKDINSTSTEKTSMQGAKLNAGNNVNLNAGNLDVTAAKDSSSSSSSAHATNAQVTVTILGTPGVNASGDHKTTTASADASTARAGEIKAGGKVNINSGGDANFTGTKIESQGKTTVNAQGDVKFGAAQDTGKSTSQTGSGNANLSVGAGSVSGGAGVAYGKNSASTTAGKGAAIDSKGGIEVNSGKNATFEGSKLTTPGDVKVTAKEKVNLLETTTRETSTSYNVGAGIKGKRTTDAPKPNSATPGDDAQANRASATPTTTPTEPKSGAGGGSRGSRKSPAGASSDNAKPGSSNATPLPTEAPKPPTTGVSAGLHNSDETKSTATSIGAGGKVDIEGGGVVKQGAKIEGASTSTVGTSEERDRTNRSSVSGFEFGVGAPTKK